MQRREHAYSIPGNIRVENLTIRVVLVAFPDHFSNAEVKEWSRNETIVVRY